MSHTNAKYPKALWDGKSESRSIHGGGPNAPDGRDWEQIVAELIATQKELDALKASSGDSPQTALLVGLPTPGATGIYTLGDAGFVFKRGILSLSIGGLAPVDQPAFALMFCDWTADGNPSNSFFWELQTDTGPVHNSTSQQQLSPRRFHLQRLGQVLQGTSQRNGTSLDLSITGNSFTSAITFGALLFKN